MLHQTGKLLVPNVNPHLIPAKRPPTQFIWTDKVLSKIVKTSKKIYGGFPGHHKC